MKRLLKNRMFLGIACIVLSLVVSLILIPTFNRGMEAKVEVIRVSENIEKGERITESMIETALVGAFNMTEVVKLKESVLGKYLIADLHKGDFILSTKLSDAPLISHNYLHGLAEDERAVSMSIKSFATGLSGKLEPGDIVSVLVANFRGSSSSYSPKELRFIEILAVTADSGWDIDKYREGDVFGEDRKLPHGVTLKASKKQAKLLVEIEANAHAHFVLVYRGSEENAKKLLDEQKILLRGEDDSFESSDEGAADEGEQ
ncbi:MAG: Flp pilus assembly protein CpaB [Alkaliphilus sp.]